MVNLEYAQKQSFLRRWRLLIISIGLLALAALPAIGWGPGLWRAAWTQHIATQARQYSFPADAVLYETDPAAMQKLLAQGGYRQGSATHTPPATTNVVFSDDPPLLAQLAQVTERGSASFQHIAAQGAMPQPLVFLQERQSPKEAKRIVAMRIKSVTLTPGGKLTVDFIDLKIEPRDGQAPAAHSVGEFQAELAFPGVAESGAIRLFAAQPDPKDASRFFLPVEVNGRRGEFRFRLVDDHLGRGAFVIPNPTQ
jgi:hypothetical protein